MRKILLVLMGFILIPMCNYALATTELSALGSPNVAIFPNSGPPGTRITVTISDIPDTSKTSYPYPDLYIYLPFSQPFGSAIQGHCGGQDCFPVYTHDDALNHDFTNRTISFTLPSTSNPKPVLRNGLENTVCDVVVNGKTIERFPTLCNTKVEPQGMYKIKIAWALETNLEQSFTVKILSFNVTSEESSSSNPIADNGDTLLKKYQNGTVSKDQFYAELKSRGWTDDQIRQALAVLGKLPHQMGIAGSDAKLSFSEENSTVISESNMSSKSGVVKIESAPDKIRSDANSSKVTLEQNKQNDSSMIKLQNTSTSLSPQNNSTVQSVQNISTPQSPQNDQYWNGMIIGLSISLVVIMACFIIFVKTKKR